MDTNLRSESGSGLLSYHDSEVIATRDQGRVIAWPENLTHPSGRSPRKPLSQAENRPPALCSPRKRRLLQRQPPNQPPFNLSAVIAWSIFASGCLGSKATCWLRSPAYPPPLMPPPSATLRLPHARGSDRRSVTPCSGCPERHVKGGEALGGSVVAGQMHRYGDGGNQDHGYPPTGCLPSATRPLSLPHDTGD